MMRLIRWMGVFLLAAGLLGACDRNTTESAEQQAAQAAEQQRDEALPPVEVANTGTRFDPAIQAAQLPPGAWYCDMGTVHYAAMERGDGRCPVCGMHLVQKPAEGSGP